MGVGGWEGGGLRLEGGRGRVKDNVGGGGLGQRNGMGSGDKWVRGLTGREGKCGIRIGKRQGGRI